MAQLDDHAATLEAMYPDIPWRKALPVTSMEDENVKGLACRICIASFGLQGCNIAKLPQSEEEFHEHMLRWHPVRPDA